MHEAIFHFPCSICWHGKAAGLCPRSSCISSPGQSLLRASGQILGRIPAPTSGALPPCSGKDPAPTHSAAPGLLGEESPVVIYPSSPPGPRSVISAWLPLRGAGAGRGEVGALPPPPARLGSARVGCVEPQRPLPGQGAAARPAAPRSCAAAERVPTAGGRGPRRGGPRLVRRTKRHDALCLADFHPRFQAYGIFILVFELWRYI